MDINSDMPTNNLASDLINRNILLGNDDTQTQVNNQSFVLPRSAWNSQIAYLKVVFRAKKALDRIELESGWLKDYSS